MVPGIGLEGLRLQLLRLHHRVVEDGFLHYDRQQSRQKRQHTRGFQLPAPRPDDYLNQPSIDDSHGDCKQHEADDGQRQSLVLAVTIVVRLVFGFRADMDESQHNDVRHEVRERMDCVGHHRGTMTHDARRELEGQQQHIHRPATQRHAVDFLVSLHRKTYFLPTNILFFSQTYHVPAEKHPCQRKSFQVR